MDREKAYEELLFKKQLTQSTKDKEIRKRLLDFMVKNARYSDPDNTRFKWWLMLLQEVDNWVEECNEAIEKAKKKKEIS